MSSKNKPALAPASQLQAKKQGGGPSGPKPSCLSEITRLQKERDERRKNMVSRGVFVLFQFVSFAGPLVDC